MFKRWQLGFGIGLLSLVMLLAACGPAGSGNQTGGSQTGESQTSGGEAGAGEEELPTVTLQGLSGGMGPIILAVIQEQGFDVKNGFKGIFDFIDPDASLQNFLQGHSDVAADMDIMGTAIARSQGHDIVTFYPSLSLSGNNSILVPVDSPHQGPKDLIGRKVGHFGTDSGTTSTLAVTLLELEGINIFDDYSFAETGPAALVELLRQGEVEAIFNFTPHLNRAILQVPARVIYDGGTAWEEAYGSGIWLTNLAAREGWLREHKELAYAVRDAYNDAHEWLSQNYDALREEPYKSMLNVDDEVIDHIIEQGKKRNYFTNEWTEDIRANAEAFLDAAAEHGILIDENPGGTMISLEEFLGPRGE